MSAPFGSGGYGQVGQNYGNNDIPMQPGGYVPPGQGYPQPGGYAPPGGGYHPSPQQHQGGYGPPQGGYAPPGQHQGGYGPPQGYGQQQPGYGPPGQPVSMIHIFIISLICWYLFYWQTVFDCFNCVMSQSSACFILLYFRLLYVKHGL